MYFVYILKSKLDGKLYTGYTSNIKRRLNQHAHGLVKSTKSRLPLIIVYLEKFKDKSSALRQEYFFKTCRGNTIKKEYIRIMSPKELLRIINQK